MRLFIFYLAVANLAGFYLMGLDKKRARCREWRISEKTLFLCSILGGCLGTWLGMYVFRHKTKHWYFVVGMPLILVLWAAGLICLYRSYPGFFC